MMYQAPLTASRVGVTDSVPLLDLRLRRNSKRLSCVRCIHTHPGGSARLSDVDIAALRSLMLDSMCAVGVAGDGHVTGVSAAFLTEKNQCRGQFNLLRQLVSVNSA